MFRRKRTTASEAISDASALTQALLRGYVAGGTDRLAEVLESRPDADTRGRAAIMLVDCLDSVLQERYGETSGVAMMFLSSQLRDNTAVVLASLAAGGEA